MAHVSQEELDEVANFMNHMLRESLLAYALRDFQEGVLRFKLEFKRLS